MGSLLLVGAHVGAGPALAAEPAPAPSALRCEIISGLCEIFVRLFQAFCSSQVVICHKTTITFVSQLTDCKSVPVVGLCYDHGLLLAYPTIGLLASFQRAFLRKSLSEDLDAYKTQRQDKVGVWPLHKLKLFHLFFNEKPIFHGLEHPGRHYILAPT